MASVLTRKSSRLATGRGRALRAWCCDAKRSTQRSLRRRAGGLLRRGLSMSGCDVAVLTNVAADHLGDYGIDDVAAMAQVKSLIGKALKPGGHRIINADDRHLMQRRLECDSPMVLFSMRHDNETLLAHRRAGGSCWWLEDDVIYFAQNGEVTQVLAARSIPCSFGGAAHHNISNALAAAAAAQVLGVSLATIARRAVQLWRIA